MNREIKFKFWCKGTSTNANFNKPGWWQYPNFLLNKYYAHLDIFERGDFIACQYTGQKDANGKEVYEGDILQGYWKAGHFGERDYKKTDLFDVGCRAGEYGFDFCLNYKNPPHPRFRKIPFIRQCVIVGNIFENPELLKQNERSD